MASRLTTLILTFLIFHSPTAAQRFETIPEGVFNEAKPHFTSILKTKEGRLLMPSPVGICVASEHELKITPAVAGWMGEEGKAPFRGKNPNITRDIFDGKLRMRAVTEGSSHIVYVANMEGNVGCFDHAAGMGIIPPPFNLPRISGDQPKITNVFLDAWGDLFMATGTEIVLMVKDADKIFVRGSKNPFPLSYRWGAGPDSELVVTQGAKEVVAINMGKGVVPTDFSSSTDEPRTVVMSTNKGVYAYDKVSGELGEYILAPDIRGRPISQVSITALGDVLFCSPEKGFGMFNQLTGGVRYFPLRIGRHERRMLVNRFARLSDREFLIASADTLPAILNVSTGAYQFIDDSLFRNKSSGNADINLNSGGSLFVIHDGDLFWCKNWIAVRDAGAGGDIGVSGPYITDVLVNGVPIPLERRPSMPWDSVTELILGPKDKSLEIYYDCHGISPDSVVYAWTVDESENNWQMVSIFPLTGRYGFVRLDDFSQGSFTLRIRARNGNGPWLPKVVRLNVIVEAPLWKKTWFMVLLAAMSLLAIFSFVKWRERVITRRERKRSEQERRAIELEARALRAQMNPHFIFNCMNSIKSLVQRGDPERAVTYLTTFSKLLRSVLDQSDKRDITLHEELATCRYYAELEAMRFGDKFRYMTDLDGSIDLKSVRVPALILQPFIENAIWHGLLPLKGEGILSVQVRRSGGMIQCIIDDNGVGRSPEKSSTFNKDEEMHESKGIHLTRYRLELDNALYGRNAAIRIHDKMDAQGQPAGTRVELTFSES